jgi:hypothetical protein
MKGERVERMSGARKDEGTADSTQSSNATPNVPIQTCIVGSPVRLIVECGKDGLRIKPSSELSVLQRTRSFNAFVDVLRRRLLAVA